MKSQIVKRSFVIASHKKSISLEAAVWTSLEELATYQDVTMVALLTTIDATRHQESLSSAIRLFILNFYRQQLEVRNRYSVVEAALRSSIRLH
jgi:predicted DNA-binding ribbon-helix-helix protein